MFVPPECLTPHLLRRSSNTPAAPSTTEAVLGVGMVNVNRCVPPCLRFAGPSGLISDTNVDVPDPVVLIVLEQRLPRRCAASGVGSPRRNR